MAAIGTGTGRRSPSPRAVIFDAGGTLIHMPRTPEEILRDLCSQRGISISPEQAAGACRASEAYYSQHYLGYTGDQGAFWLVYHAAAVRHLGLDDLDGAMAAFLSNGFGRAGVWQAYSEAAGVCRRLGEMGLRLGVISNGSVTVRDLLRQSGLLDFFEVVIASQDLAIQKPDPRIFAAALAALGVAAGDAVYVGDLYDVDVSGARAAGMTAVLIDREGGPERDCPTLRNLEGLVPLIDKLSTVG